MAKHVIETVTFRLKNEISRAEFRRAAEAVSAFVSGREGFISRRLSCGEDGLWIEHIEWADMAAAREAAKSLDQDDANMPFLSAMDGSSVTQHHTELEVAVN